MSPMESRTQAPVPQGLPVGDVSAQENGIGFGLERTKDPQAWCPECCFAEGGTGVNPIAIGRVLSSSSV